MSPSAITPTIGQFSANLISAAKTIYFTYKTKFFLKSQDSDLGTGLETCDAYPDRAHAQNDMLPNCELPAKGKKLMALISY